jgi:TonB family protein
MKICPKCARSFADGFKYCPGDATELVKYDLRAHLRAHGELQFLMKNRPLFARLRDEIADAVHELKRSPLRYIINLLRGEGSNRRRQRLLQAGVATALITYSSIILIVMLVGILKAPMTGTKADNLRPHEDLEGPVRLSFEPENTVIKETKTGRGALGGSLKQPKRPGGGGGANDEMPASRGKMPTTSFNPQINLPDISQPKILTPPLIVPETVYADPLISRRLNVLIGNPDGQLEAPSRGAKGGTGVGDGNGPGFGLGKGGNSGDGPMELGGGPHGGPDDGSDVITGKPTILYKERARYTEEARRNLLQGTVVLSVVFGADGLLHDIRTIKGLPYGLTENAIEAAKNIRFQPAMRYGKPVNVRTVLEFNFALY